MTFVVKYVILSVIISIFERRGIFMKCSGKLTAVLTAAALAVWTVTFPVSAETSPDSFEYSEADGKVTITAYNGSDKIVEIPSRIDGNPVFAIGDGAFYGCSGIVSAEIPDGVKVIGKSAFEGCGSLTSVNMPDSVSEIGNSAFFGCFSLSAIDIPDPVETIGSMAFYNCSSLRTAVIPSPVKELDGTFWHCSGLTSVTIPEGLTNIGCLTFAGCTSLRSVNIPSSVTNIGDRAFYGCSGLSVPAIDPLTTVAENAFEGCSGQVTPVYEANAYETDGVNTGSEAVLPEENANVPEYEENKEDEQVVAVMAKTPLEETPLLTGEDEDKPESEDSDKDGDEGSKEQSVYIGEDISSGAGAFVSPELL